MGILSSKWIYSRLVPCAVCQLPMRSYRTERNANLRFLHVQYSVLVTRNERYRTAHRHDTLRYSTSCLTKHRPTMPSLAATIPNSNDTRLRDGPCADPYALLQKCQASKGIQKASNAMTFCVSETDLLIKCIHKNPAFFYESNMKK
jgi:hypothetical protein